MRWVLNAGWCSITRKTLIEYVWAEDLEITWATCRILRKGSTILRIFSARGLPSHPPPSLCGKFAILTPWKISKNVARNKLADSGGTPSPPFRKNLQIFQHKIVGGKTTFENNCHRNGLLASWCCVSNPSPSHNFRNLHGISAAFSGLPSAVQSVNNYHGIEAADN